MFINNSVGRGANINILEAIHLLSAAKRTSSAATIVQCFHKTGIIPQDKCEIESGSDVDLAKNWQHLGQKLNADAEFDGFIHVDDDVIAASLLQRSQGNLGMTCHWWMRRTITMMKMPLPSRSLPILCDVFGAL